MKTLALLPILLLGTTPTVFAADPPAQHGHATESHALNLSPHLISLLKEEMRAITDGVRTIAPAIAIGDWGAIEGEAGKIKASYILNKRLSPEDAEDLERGLSAGFKRLDWQFHERAGALVEAAQRHNADLVLHQFNKLMEACVACHSEYAAPRFPSLSPTPRSGEHAHHK